MAKIVLMLQVRLGSSRLPAKALLDLVGLPVITHAMKALRLVPVDDYYLVTDAESAPRLKPLADREDFGVFVGDPENVLARYCACAEATDADVIIRATGDNPLVSPMAARLARALQEGTRCDYAGIVGTPYGTGVEVISASALLEASRGEPSDYEREHVTAVLYRHPERYRIEMRQAPSALSCPDLRVTLDTDEDYRWLQQLFGELWEGRPLEIPELIRYAVSHQKSSA